MRERAKTVKDGSRGDGAARARALEGRVDVRALMTRELVLAGPGDPADELLARMDRGGFHHVLVVGDGLADELREVAPRDGTRGPTRVPVEALLGIVSAQDVLENMRELDSLQLRQVAARDLMSPAPLVTVSSSASLKQALQVLCDCSVSALPVLEHGFLVGLVTTKDVLHTVALALRPSA